MLRLFFPRWGEHHPRRNFYSEIPIRSYGQKELLQRVPTIFSLSCTYLFLMKSFSYAFPWPGGLTLKTASEKKSTFRLSRELFLLLQHVRDVLEHKNWTFYPIDTLLNLFFYQNQLSRPLPSMTEHPYKLHENKTIQRLSRELLCCSNASGTSWSTKNACFSP